METDKALDDRRPMLNYEPACPALLPDVSTPPTAYAWLVVGLLGVVALLNYLDRLMITSMVGKIRPELGISSAEFGLFTSVFLWVYAVLNPLGGFLADRVGRTVVIVASLFFWSAATCISGFAHSYHEMLAARALMGISEACYMPAALAMISDYHRGRTRSLATGLHMVGSYCGAALGGLGGYIAESVGWRFGFRIFGAIGIGYAVVLLLALRDQPKIASPGGAVAAAPRSQLRIPDMLAALLASPGFWILLAVNVLVGICNWSIYGWLPAYLKDRFNLGLGAAGLSATFYFQCASLVGVLVSGAVADWWRQSNRRARALVPAIGFCLAGPGLMAIGSAGLLFIVIVALLIVGLGRAAFDSNQMPLIRELVDERCSATGFGILNLISTAAGGVAVYAGGAMQDHQVSLSLVFQFCGGAMLLAGLLLWVGIGSSEPIARAEGSPTRWSHRQ